MMMVGKIGMKKTNRLMQAGNKTLLTILSVRPLV